MKSLSKLSTFHLIVQEGCIVQSSSRAHEVEALFLSPWPFKGSLRKEVCPHCSQCYFYERNLRIYFWAFRFTFLGMYLRVQLFFLAKVFSYSPAVPGQDIEVPEVVCQMLVFGIKTACLIKDHYMILNTFLGGVHVHSHMYLQSVLIIHYG